MRKLKVTTFVSLDGVVQAPGGPEEDRDGGFQHGGWAVPYIDGEVIELTGKVLGRAGALLFGRRTYEEFAATWPLAEADDPIGAMMNGMPKYVASRTLTAVDWRNSTLLTGDVADAVRDLKAREGGEIQVHGSGGLVKTLLRHDLVDELHLLVVPVVVGSGKRLFGAVPGGFRLLDTSATGTGIVVSGYARAGDLAYGAMGPETGNW
jgi:dihydrofolate reductase